MSTTRSRSQRQIGRSLGDYERRLRNLEREQRLRDARLPNAFAVTDHRGIIRILLGTQPDGQFAVTSTGGLNPPKPAQPVLAPLPSGLLVMWTGLTAAGAGEEPLPSPPTGPGEGDADYWTSRPEPDLPDPAYDDARQATETGDPYYIDPDVYLDETGTPTSITDGDWVSPDGPLEPDPDPDAEFADELGRWPSDLSHIEIHCKQSTGTGDLGDFACVADTQIGTFQTAGKAARHTLTGLGAQQDYWVRLVAVSKSNKESRPSTPIAVTTLQDALETAVDAFDAANAAAADAADAAAAADAAQTTANGRNTVHYSTTGPDATANTAGDIWFVKDAATQTITEQWQGLGDTSWQQVTLADAVIANLDAGKLVAGSAFINGLWVKTALTLGDATTNGSIQSHDFATSAVGVYMDKFGLVAKGGDITGTTITAANIRTSTMADRGIKFDDTKFEAWTSDGSSRFFNINLVTGVVGLYSPVLEGTTTVAGPLTFTNDDDLTGVHRVEASGEVHGNDIFADSQTGSGDINAVIGATGKVKRDTSSRRYKANITELDVDLDAVLALTPVTFTKIGNDEPTPTLRYAGFIAEDAHDLGLATWVTYDAQGRPDGFHYPAFTAAQHAVIRHHATEIATLKAQVAALQAAA